MLSVLGTADPRPLWKPEGVESMRGRLDSALVKTKERERRQYHQQPYSQQQHSRRSGYDKDSRRRRTSRSRSPPRQQEKNTEFIVTLDTTTGDSAQEPFWLLFRSCGGTTTEKIGT